jgi:hypothetical protein
MKNSTFAAALAVALAAVALLPVQAQTHKTVVAEPLAILSGFSQWAEAVAVPLPDTWRVDASRLQLLQLGGTPASAGSSPVYHPKPVILGHPELPLLGDAADAASGGTWAPGLNYQGLHAKLVLLDERGTARSMRPLNTVLRAGQRFKVRITPTFDAVAAVDRLFGDTWSLRRVGQFYPAPGLSVQVRAGETADLPMGAEEYFVMPPNAAPFVVSVRHAQAIGERASDQPAYRHDGARGSNYLQLVPQGQWPAIEQQVGAVR